MADAEAQVEALRQFRERRNEEWQKVRNPGVITEKDKEEEFETKTLYERLQENRELKRQEIEEQFRYKNMVYSGLDNDEHKFLEEWQNNKKTEDKKRIMEESEELQKFKARVVDLEATDNLKEKLTKTISTATPVVSRQKQMLLGVVKKRKLTKPPEAPSSTATSTSAISAPSSGGLLSLGAYSSSSDGDTSSPNQRPMTESRDTNSPNQRPPTESRGNKRRREKKSRSSSSSSSSSSGSSSSSSSDSDSSNSSNDSSSGSDSGTGSGSNSDSKKSDKSNI